MALPIVFNILDWNEHDEKQHYIIKIFGRCADGKGVSVKVLNYSPYFYVEIPTIWDSSKVFKFVEQIKKLNPQWCKIKKHEIVERHKLLGFTAGEKFKYIKLIFYNVMSMKSTVSTIKKNYISIDSGPKIYTVVENNIDPFLRFIHEKDINSAGWIKVNKYENNITELSTRHHNIIANYTDIEPVENDALAPFVSLSFDIECTSCDGGFPQADRKDDKIIQIGAVFYKGDVKTKRYIITLKSCSPITDDEVETIVDSKNTEKEVLEEFARLLQKEDPDVILGYNIVGFDQLYMYNRWLNIYFNFDPIIFGYFTCSNDKDITTYYKNNSKYLEENNIDKYSYWTMIKQRNKICDNFSNFSVYYETPAEFKTTKLSSSGLGDNIYSYFNMVGRLQIDLMKVVQRDYKLDSYKLDFVSQYFMKQNINKINYIGDSQYEFELNEISNISIGNYIKLLENDEDAYDAKLKIIDIIDNKIIVTAKIDIDSKTKYSFSVVKDDIKPSDIFEKQKGNSDDRMIVAKYCLQDCELVAKLFFKLQMLINNMSMASVCHVPTAYILLRGQGIKILSLIAKFCMKENYIIPNLQKPFKEKLDEDDDTNEGSYEGAIVFNPEIGFHTTPITVMDFNSLYPSSMIAENISHETLVLDPMYDNLDGYEYRDIKYKQGSTMMTCRFARGDKPGIIPQILQNLLGTRKKFKKKMEAEQDPFKKKLYEGMQLAYKLTANSLYGQLGAGTSAVYMKECAASTTAAGRNMLEIARHFVENEFVDQLTPEDVNEKYIINPKYDIIKYEKINTVVKILKTPYNGLLRIYSVIPKSLRKGITVLIDNCRMTVLKINKDSFEIGLEEDQICSIDDYSWWMFGMVIYGDTDSIFIRMNLIDKDTGEFATDKNALDNSIKLGELASKLLKKKLREPHNMEYEKTFYPFMIMAKKKYVGNKYTSSINKYEFASMGIVLKRRDNPLIVKKGVKTLLTILLDTGDVNKTLKYTKEFIKEVINGKYSYRYFVTSKSLKDNYKISYDILDDDGNITRDENKRKKVEKLTISMKHILDKISTGNKNDKIIEHLAKLSQAHCILAARIADRDPGNTPQLNDRIPFIFIEKDTTGKQKILQGEKIETPDYIYQNKLKVDYMHYITNQLMNPMNQILELIIDDPKIMFTDIINNYKKKQAIHINLNKYTSLNSIKNFFI